MIPKLSSKKVMIQQLQDYYLTLPEPTQGCFLAVRDYILAYDPLIAEAWKYRTPFFCYRGRIMSYLWINRKTQQPYLGVMDGKLIEHPQLRSEGRARVKVLSLDPAGELPLDVIDFVLQQSIALRQQ